MSGSSPSTVAPIRLDQEPDWLREQADEIASNYGETLIGFCADTKVAERIPGPARIAYWIVITSGGMYWIDPDTRLVMRAKSVHTFKGRIAS